LLGVVESVVEKGGRGVRFRLGEGRDRRGAVIHFERRAVSKRFVRDSVIREAYA
jgi:hypothetical protein